MTVFLCSPCCQDRSGTLGCLALWLQGSISPVTRVFLTWKQERCCHHEPGTLSCQYFLQARCPSCHRATASKHWLVSNCNYMSMSNSMRWCVVWYSCCDWSTVTLSRLHQLHCYGRLHSAYQMTCPVPTSHSMMTACLHLAVHVEW